MAALAKKTFTKSAYIPSGVLEALKPLAVGKTPRYKDKHLSNLKKQYTYIQGRIMMSETSFLESKDISSKHFRLNVGSHYRKDLGLLIDAGIIGRDETEYKYYTSRNGTGRCMKYFVNPDLICSDPVLIEYEENIPEFDFSDPTIKSTVENLGRIKCTLNKKEYTKHVYNTITSETVRRDRCLINNQIPDNKYRLGNIEYPLKKLKEFAEESNKDLILYKGKCHIAYASKFVEARTQNIRLRYLNDFNRVSSLRKRSFITCRRNETNGRLDHNLTNAHSGIRQFLMLDGERLATGCDLSNSQFTILSALFEQIYNSTCDGGGDNTRDNDTFLDITNNQLLKSVIESKESNFLNQGEAKSYFSKSSFLFLINLFSLYVTQSLVKIEENDKLTDSKPIDYLSYQHSQKTSCNEVNEHQAACTPDNKVVTLHSDARRFMTFTKLGLFYEEFAGLAFNELYYTLTESKSFFELSKKIDCYRMPHIYGSYYAVSESEHLTAKKDFKRIRGEAKTAMFVTFFAKAGYNPRSKQIIKKHFPSIVGFMDGFKKAFVKHLENEGLNKKEARKKGNAALAVLLQTVEAYIFIDSMLPDLLGRKISALPLHDSILCKESDLKRVKKIMSEHLTKHLGANAFNMKIERY